MIKYFFLALLFFVGCSSDSREYEYNTANGATNVHNVNTLQSEQDTQNQEESSAVTSFYSFVSGSMKWIFITSLLLFISALLYFVYRNNRQRVNRLNSDIKELQNNIDFIFKKIDSINKNYVDVNNDLNKNLKSKIGSLEIEINSIKGRNNVVNKNNVTNEYKKDLESISTHIKEPIIKFFTAPDEHGQFDNKRASDNPQGRVYFSISYSENKKEGIIDYHQGKLDQSAIDQRDSILKPVCVIRNPEFMNPTRINQIKSGKVEMINDTWQIQEKIQIEFV